MKYSKLNTNWKPEPNAPNLQIVEGEGYIEIKFKLHPSEFKYLDEGDQGVLEFSEVHKIDVGTMNDEGYYLGHHRFSIENLPWGNFYELFDSNWEHDFPNDARLIDANLEHPNLKHFILFLRDNTIECLANESSFYIQFKDEDHYAKKYPNQYFDHFLNMYSLNLDELNRETSKKQIKMYIEMEGIAEFNQLQLELMQIELNNDFKWFVKQCYSNGLLNVDLENIKILADQIAIYQS